MVFFFFSAFITPPEVMALIVVAFPFVVFYEFFVFYPILKKNYMLVRQPIKTNQNTYRKNKQR